MTTAQLISLDSPEATEVFRWRFSTLAAAGYELGDALRLALDGDVDLHAAASLLARGCPSATAVRILL
jgi:hypothetical protein